MSPASASASRPAHPWLSPLLSGTGPLRTFEVAATLKSIRPANTLLSSSFGNGRETTPCSTSEDPYFLPMKTDPSPKRIFPDRELRFQVFGNAFLPRSILSPFAVAVRRTSSSRGGRVIGVQPRALPWRAMKSFYDGDGIRIKAPGEKNCR